MDVAFLIEPALKAGVAPVAARNFNPLMAMAVATLIAETNEIVPLGVLPPDAIHTAGMLIDHLIERPRLG